MRMFRYMQLASGDNIYHPMKCSQLKTISTRVSINIMADGASLLASVLKHQLVHAVCEKLYTKNNIDRENQYMIQQHDNPITRH